jgi:iron-sulfur cluster insertion protein
MEENLLMLTDGAAEAIRKICKSESMPDDCRLRVRVVGGGCAGFSYDMNFDEVTEGGTTRPAVASDPVSEMDKVIEHKGVTLIVDTMSLMYIVGTTIDYVDTLQATGFKFENPNTSSQCGCGSSFSV